jgi:hypothetical protein
MTGEAVGSYRSSGNEDMYETSYIWEQEPPRTYTTNRFVPYFNIDQRKLWGAVFLPVAEAPRAEKRLMLKHYNGDADYHTPPGPIVSRITTFYYLKPVATGGVTRLAAPVVTTSPLNGGLSLAWGGVANAPAANNYVVKLDKVTVTTAPAFDSATNTYKLTFTGLGTGSHTATVQAVASGYTSSSVSSGTVTVTTAPTTPAVLDLTVDPASPNVVLVNGLVASVSDGSTTFNRDAGDGGSNPNRRPTFIASDSNFNGLPVFQLAGAQEMEGGFAKATESTFSPFLVGQFSGLGAIFGNRISNIDPTHYYTAGNEHFEATKLSGNTLLYNTSNAPKLVQVDVCQSFIRIYENEVAKVVLLNPAEYVSDTYQNLVALFATVVAGVPSNFLTGKFAYLVRYGGDLVTDANRVTISAQLKAKFALQY